MTNYEKIKNMSVEEMAKDIENRGITCICCVHFDNNCRLVQG